MISDDRRPQAAESSEVTALPKARFNWVLFISFLVMAPLGSLISAAAGLRDVPVVVALVGGGVAGIGCGILLGAHLGRTSASRVALGILLTVVFVVVCVTASTFGCLAGGYRLDFR